MQKKSQGEIFGLALFFVVLIIGLIVYSQIKALNPNDELSKITENKYKIISEGTLNSILKLSTSCYVERSKDSVTDLINYCLENSFSGKDPQFLCDDGKMINSCNEVIILLNSTLYQLFKNENLGKIPFLLTIDVPRNDDSLLNNITITNLNNFTYKGSTLTLENYRKYRFKKAPSGLKTWPTAQGNIELELALYYK